MKKLNLICNKYLQLLLVILLPVFTQMCTSQPFETETTEEGMLISENGENVLFFQQATKSLDGEYARANYIHPLYGLSGEVLTEDFPEDHYHQRGIFWAWHQIYAGDERLGDGWSCENISWNVTDVSGRHTDDGKFRLDSKCEWLSPNYTNDEGEQVAFAHDMANIVIHPKEEHYRIIDFSIQIKALIPDLYIGGSEDAKGYGGFSLRVKLPEDLHFVSLNGEVEAQTLAVEAGPWMDIRGNFVDDASTKAATVMVHNSNPKPINDWILRYERSMQNPVFPGNVKYHVGMDEGVELKYRVILHDGSLGTDDLGEMYSEYVGM